MSSTRQIRKIRRRATMFTGIVEEKGAVRSLESRPEGIRLRIAAGDAFAALPRGSSVCVSGACLTVAESVGGVLEFDVVAETCRRTRLGRLRAGDSVNLERSLAAGARLEGHFVLGHVDAVVTVTGLLADPSDWILEFRVPGALERLVAEKGSIALDGVSLTVARRRADLVSVALIPVTRERTTLGESRVGAPLHFEADVLARYVARLVGGPVPPGSEERE